MLSFLKDTRQQLVQLILKMKQAVIGHSNFVQVVFDCVLLVSMRIKWNSFLFDRIKTIFDIFTT